MKIYSILRSVGEADLAQLRGAALSRRGQAEGLRGRVLEALERPPGLKRGDESEQRGPEGGTI